MTEPVSNVIPWHTQMPAEVSPEQLATAEGELHRLLTPGPLQSVAPLDDLSPDSRGVFERYAFHAGQAGIEQVEMRARKFMRDPANAVPEAEVRRFKMATFVRHAKDYARRLVDQEKRLAQRARANVGKTDAGRPDSDL